MLLSSDVLGHQMDADAVLPDVADELLGLSRYLCWSL